MQAKVVEEHVKTKQEYLSGEIRSLLVSWKSLTISRKRLQESSRLFAGERGYGSLNTLEKMLRARQQHMTSHVSFIYPVKTLIGATQELELDSFPNCTSSGSSSGSVDEYRAFAIFSNREVAEMVMRKLEQGCLMLPDGSYQCPYHKDAIKKNINKPIVIANRIKSAANWMSCKQWDRHLFVID